MRDPDDSAAETQAVTRREFGVGTVGIGLAAGAMPLSLASLTPDALTPAAAEAITGWTSVSASLDGWDVTIQRYGNEPSWHVEHGGSASALQDWADGDDARQYIRDSSTERATIAAPAGHITGRGLNATDSPLIDETYVSTVDVNVRVRRPSPDGF